MLEASSCIPSLSQPHYRHFTVKPRLIQVSGIRALLDLKHLDFFEYFEPVSSSDEQNDVSGFQFAALQVILSLIEKIYSQPPALNEKCLLGVGDIARNQVVEMR